MKIIQMSVLAAAIASSNALWANGDVTDESFTRGDWSIFTNDELAQRNDNADPAGPIPSATGYTINEYDTDNALPPVSAYVSDWGQYGRKVNMDGFVSAYDTVIISFFGLCGTKVGDNALPGAIESLNASCDAFGMPEASFMIADPWGDIQSTAGGALTKGDQAALGNPDWVSGMELKNDYYLQGQANVAGVLGALYQQHEANPTQVKALSLGGWSMSESFSRFFNAPATRKTVVDSLVEFIGLYPMFTQVDIDWEYPGGGGASENSSNEKDGENYVTFVQELRAALDETGKNNVKIAVAAPAPTDKIDAMNIKSLSDNGVDIIHLMTYDFFGTPWAEQLDHHTNLFPSRDGNGSEVWSADTSVTYLIDDLQVPSEKIFLGYATYSRNARNAEVTSYSPLVGSYAMPVDDTHVGGSWELGVNEWYDVEKYLTTVSQADGFVVNKVDDYNLYTDEVANADYIYNAENNYFMSLDTPRTVFLKGQYVQEKQLGGLFTWMADYDTGYLLNAAREGLGYEPTANAGNVDMTNIIYSCGVNITSREQCEELTTLTEDDDGGEPGEVTEAKAGDDVNAQLAEGAAYPLDGSASKSGEGDLQYTWKVNEIVKGGLTIEDVIIDDPSSEMTSFTITDADQLDKAVIKFKLTVKDEGKNKDSDKVKFTLNAADPENQAPVADAEADKSDVTVGSNVTLIGDGSSDPDGDALTYRWEQDSGASVDFDNTATNPVIDTSKLRNVNDTLAFTLTVSDNSLQASDAVSVNIQVNQDDNQLPVAAIQTAGDTVGERVTLDGTGSTDDGEITGYQWVVSDPAGTPLAVTNATAVTASFVPADEGEYIISLEVTDNLNEHSSSNVALTVNSEDDSDVPHWDANKAYATECTMVQHEGHYFHNQWYANSGDEPDHSNADDYGITWLLPESSLNKCS